MTEKNRALPRIVPVVVLAVIGLACAVLGQLQLADQHLTGIGLVGMAVALWALIGGVDEDSGADRILLDVALVVALAFHLWNLAGFPPGLFYDEAANALEAQQLVASPGVSIWSDHLSGRPTLFLYAIGFAQKLFGDTRLTLRLVVVTANMATTLLLVWAVAPLVGSRVARIAGALFGFSFYHMLFSRFVYEASISSLPLLLAVGCLIRAWTAERRVLWWIGWGTALGAGLWTYAAFRIVPLLFIPAIVVLWLRSRDERRRLAIGAAAGIVAATLAASPLLVFAGKHPGQFSVRAQQTTVLTEVEHEGSWEPLRRNLVTYGLMFFSNPKTSNQIYQFPALAVSAAALAWVGIGLGIGGAVRDRHRWRWLLVFYWWLAGLVPGVITVSIEAPHWSRTLYALPAVMVVASVALDRVSGLCGPRVRPVLTAALLASVLGTEAVAASRYLFHEPRTLMFFTPVASEAGRLAREAMSEGDDVLAGEDLVVGSFVREVFRFHAGESRDRVRSVTPWRTMPEPRRQRPLTVLLTHGDRRVAELFDQLYPDAEHREHRLPWGGILLQEYRLPAHSPVPLGNITGVLVRLTGDYAVSLPAGQQVRIGPWELVDGGDIWLPAGSWDVQCSSACAEIDARFEGPEAFHLVDRLVPDRFAGRGLIACYRDGDGPPSYQLDRAIDANCRGVPRSGWSIVRAGELEAPDTGTYHFELVSDDGSRLWLNDTLVIDNWGFHGSITKSADIELTGGRNRIRIDYFQGEGGAELHVLWKPPSLDHAEPLPPEVLHLPADLDAVLAEISTVQALSLSDGAGS